VGDGEVGVFVVGGEEFGGFVSVAYVGAGDVVGEGVSGGELMVGGWSGDDVAAAG